MHQKSRNRRIAVNTWGFFLLIIFFIVPTAYGNVDYAITAVEFLSPPNGIQDPEDVIEIEITVTNYGGDTPQGYFAIIFPYFNMIPDGSVHQGIAGVAELPGNGAETTLTAFLEMDENQNIGVNDVYLYADYLWEAPEDRDINLLNNTYQFQITWQGEEEPFITEHYPWPIMPQDQSHRLTSMINEFRLPPPSDHIHQGIDIYAPRGTPVYPVSPGYFISATKINDNDNDYAVVFGEHVNRQPPYYKYIHIRDIPGTFELQKWFSTVNDAGQIISLGTTGINHLHFEDWTDINSPYAVNPHHPKDSSNNRGFAYQWQGDIYPPQIETGEVGLIILGDDSADTIPAHTIDRPVDFVICAKDSVPFGRAGLARIRYRLHRDEDVEAGISAYDSDWIESVTLDNYVYPQNVLSYLYCSTGCRDDDPYYPGNCRTSNTDWVRYYITNNITEPSQNPLDYAGSFDPRDHDLGPHTLSVEVFDFSGRSSGVTNWPVDLIESAK